MKGGLLLYYLNIQWIYVTIQTIRQLVWSFVANTNNVERKRAMHNLEIEAPQILGMLIGAVIAGMKEVSSGQINPPAQVSLKRGDGTLVTSTDLKSQEQMVKFLHGIPYVAVCAEESEDGLPVSPYVAFVDPLDGTGAYANGLMTSTVIAGLYESETKRLKACAIGEAATRRVWSADSERQTRFTFYSPSAHFEQIIHYCGDAWTDRKRDLGPKDYIFLDVTHAFKTGLGVEQMKKLLGSLVDNGIKFHVPGSNGLIHALVANGASSAAGSISTAKGGPWDFCGALLVKQAGGFVRGFKKTENQLIEHDGLDPVGCDFLITANSELILRRLTKIFLKVFC